MTKRKAIALLLVSFLAAIVVSVAGATQQSTKYFEGVETSNAWKLSPSYAHRYFHSVNSLNGCLPSFAQFQVANFAQDGSMINTHRSNYGACNFSYALTSNGLYAKAGCRIVVTGSESAARTIQCWSTWD